MTPDLYRKQKGSSSSHDIAIYHKWKLSAIPKLRYHDHKVFGLWPLVTSNNLWPPPKTIGFFQSTWQSYIKYENCRPFLPWDIAITRFLVFDSGDLKWPLTSTKNNRILPVSMTKLYQIWKLSDIPILRYRDYEPFMRFSQFYLRWPQMTSDLYQKQ